ncbi:hypothetical protein FS842_007821 [Serendipita sp. 407]|nr:hypothetical protein FS842_007821 [Serendipita sp. 407]
MMTTDERMTTGGRATGVILVLVLVLLVAMMTVIETIGGGLPLHFIATMIAVTEIVAVIEHVNPNHRCS